MHLEPLILKKIEKYGMSFRVKLGEKVLDTTNEFRLYITTKLSNAKF